MELADVADSKSAGSDTVPVRLRPAAPRRSKVRFAPFFYAEKHPPAPLLLLFRKKSRLFRLCPCKRGHNGAAALSTFFGDAPSAYRYHFWKVNPRRGEPFGKPYFYAKIRLALCRLALLFPTKRKSLCGVTSARRKR